MSVYERLLALRLLEKQEQNSEAMARMGVKISMKTRDKSERKENKCSNEAK